MEEAIPKMSAGEAQMRDNPGGELDTAVDDCKQNSPSISSCSDKRTNEGCDRDIEVWTVLYIMNNKTKTCKSCTAVGDARFLFCPYLIKFSLI